MNIGIEVNGVLRDTLGKIEQIYTRWYAEPFELIEDKTNLFEYKIHEPIDSLNIAKHFPFPNDEDLYNFLYVEHPMEIFGHSGSVEFTSMNDLNDLYYDLRDNHNIKIISDEIGKSKPATLFFLSKYGCLIEDIIFYSDQTINKIWDNVDVLLTANPTIIEKAPKNKIVIKYKTKYNNSITTKFSIEKLKELPTFLENL